MMKIRVLHLITRMIRGGADENTACTVKGLNKDVFDVDTYGGIESETDGFPDIKIGIVTHLIREICLWKDFIAFIELFCIMRKNRYHIVHTHTAKAGILGRWAAYLNKVPIIIHTLHGTTFHDSMEPWKQNFYIRIEKFTARITHKLISVGDDLIKRYLDKGIGKNEQFVTIRSGMDLGKFYNASKLGNIDIIQIKKDLEINPKRRIVIQIARLEPRKGYNYLVDASKKVMEKLSDVLFLVVGEGNQRDEIVSLIKKAGMEENFLFLGYREDIERIIAISDVVVLSSLWEGLPRILVQSCAVGRPIVSFEVEGAREVVKDGVNGFVVEIGDVESFAEKIVEVLKNSDYARVMGNKGREIIGTEWNSETMVAKIEALYYAELERTGLKPG